MLSSLFPGLRNSEDGHPVARQNETNGMYIFLFSRKKSPDI